MNPTRAMNPLTVTRRALRDVYDNILPVALATAAWWLLLPTVVLVPAATLWLFSVTDPRVGGELERPPLRQSLGNLFRGFRRGWALAVCTVPAVALFVFNVRYYGMSDGPLGVLAPLWLLLVVVGTLWTLAVFALGAMRGHPVRKTLKLAGQVVIARLASGVAILLLTLVVPTVLLGAVVWFTAPLILALPPICAAALDRWVLTALGIEIWDPNAPTEERLAERAAEGR